MVNDILTKTLMGSYDVVGSYLSDAQNNSNSHFPLSLKDVTPIHKAKERIYRKNYIPVSLILILSSARKKHV